MIEDSAKNLVELKQEFRRIYSGSSHIQEIIPLTESTYFPIRQDELESLHLFAAKIQFTIIRMSRKLMRLNAWYMRETLTSIG